MKHSKHYALGQSFTLLLYAAMGPYVFALQYLSGSVQVQTMHFWVVYWAVTGVACLLIRKSAAYRFFMLVVAGIFSSAIFPATGNIYSVICIFMVQWVGAVFFIDNRVCITVLGTETVLLAYLAFELDKSEGIWLAFTFCILAIFITFYACYRITGVIAEEIQQNEKGLAERAKLLKELEERYRESTEALTAKTEFLANMSHEIRTPLGAIIGFNEVCIRECRQSDLNDYLQKIAVASRSLLTIINDILDFSKVEASCMQIIDTDYSTAEMLDNSMQINMIRAAEKNLSLSIDVDPNVPAMLCGDMLRNGQVLNNLLSNAIKYTKVGFVNVSVWTEPTEEADKVELYLSVKDTGNGIRQDDIDKLFETFKRIDLEKNRSIEGTGLGLPLTKRLVQQIGGDISVESVYSLGSIFTVHFPQTVSNPTPIGNYRVSQSVKARPIGTNYHSLFTAPSARVLVVDDSNLNLMVVKSLLKETQVQITLCSSGRECLEKIAQEHFDLIFLDDMMPNMTGTETLERANQMDCNRCAGVPIVALTANAVSGAREQYLSAGFSAYLSKPIVSLELESLMLSLLPERLIESKWDPDSKKMQSLLSSAPTAPAARGAVQATAPKEEPPEPDPNPSELLDRSTGLKYCGGLPEMYSEILSIFVKEGPRQLSTIEILFQAQDWKNYTISVHSLKSTALTIGAVAFSDQAKAQEEACKAGRTQEILRAHAPLMKQYRIVLSAAQKLLQA